MPWTADNPSSEALSSEKTSDGTPLSQCGIRLKLRRGFFYEDRAGELWYGIEMVARVFEKAGTVKWQELPLHLPIEQFGVYRIIEAADASKWVMTNVGAVRYLPDGRSPFYMSPDYLTAAVNKLDNVFGHHSVTKDLLVETDNSVIH